MSIVKEAKQQVAENNGFKDWDEYCICTFGVTIGDSLDNLMKMIALRSASAALLNAASGIDKVLGTDVESILNTLNIPEL